MPTRPETPHADIVQIRTGHFRKPLEYAIHRSRGTPNHLLIYTKSGSGCFHHAQGDLVARPSDVVLLEPGTLHDYGTLPKAGHWELLWAHFHPQADWHPWLAFPAAAPGLRHLRLRDAELRERVERALLEMNWLVRAPFRHNESLAMNKLEEVLLWCDLGNPNATSKEIDPRIVKAGDLIRSNLKQAIVLGDLARRCGLSRSRFADLFQKQMGTTPQRYQEAQRVGRARELLEFSSASVTQIAENLGFSTRFYFSFRFRRALGKSPSEYRQSKRKAG